MNVLMWEQPVHAVGQLSKSVMKRYDCEVILMHFNCSKVLHNTVGVPHHHVILLHNSVTTARSDWTNDLETNTD